MARHAIPLHLAVLACALSAATAIKCKDYMWKYTEFNIHSVECDPDAMANWCQEERYFEPGTNCGKKADDGSCLCRIEDPNETCDGTKAGAVPQRHGVMVERDGVDCWGEAGCAPWCTAPLDNQKCSEEDAAAGKHTSETFDIPICWKETDCSVATGGAEEYDNKNCMYLNGFTQKDCAASSCPEFGDPGKGCVRSYLVMGGCVRPKDHTTYEETIPGLPNMNYVSCAKDLCNGATGRSVSSSLLLAVATAGMFWAS